MTPREFKEATGRTFEGLADELNCSRETVRQNCLPAGSEGHHVPRPDAMRAWFEVSDGAVSPIDHYAFTQDELVKMLAHQINGLPPGEAEALCVTCLQTAATRRRAMGQAGPELAAANG